MIDIVLDQHREEDSPIILVGELPGMVANAEVSVVLTLRLCDDRPVLGVTLKANGNPLPYDYYFALDSEAHFVSWHAEIWRLMGSSVTTPFNSVMNATSSAGLHLDVTLVRGTSPKNLRIFTYPSRSMKIEGGSFDLWLEEFGRILELGAAISRYVTDLREQQREALLQHIDALLVRSAL